MRKSDKTNMQQASRRNFLKTSTLAMGTTMAASSLSIGRSAHAAGDDVLKVGLVGCGGRGTGAASNALNADKNAKLVAFADAFKDKALASRDRLKKTKPDQVDVDDDHCFSGFDAYQKLIDSDVDVVLLATPPHFRPMQLKACIDAGKHVFCEKPVAVDAPGIRSVMATSKEAKEKGLSLVSGLCWRYHPAIKATMQRLLDGAIGDIVAMQEVYNTGFTGRQQERTPAMTEMEFQMRSWYFFTWLSGDHNVEQHVHSLDKASWLMHDQPPVKAWGLGGRQVPKLGDIFDHHAVCYEYAGGIRLYAYTRQISGCKNFTTDDFFGTKGSCNVLNSHTIKGENPWKYRGPNGNMYDLEHVALFESIRSGKPINNGHYMSVSTMLAILGRMCTYSGKEITWDEAINSKQTLAPKSYAWDAEPPTMPDADGNYPIAIPGVTKVV